MHISACAVPTKPNQSSCGHRRVVFSCRGHCAHLSGSSGAAQRHGRQRLDASSSSTGPPEAQLKISLCHRACVWFSSGHFYLGSLLSRVPSTPGSLTALPPISSSPAQPQSRQTGWNRRPKCSLGAQQTSGVVLPSSPRDMGAGGSWTQIPKWHERSGQGRGNEGRHFLLHTLMYI